MSTRALDIMQVGELDVAAASGAAIVNGRLCVIADDEMFLAMYELPRLPTRLPTQTAALHAPLTCLQRVAMFDGALPEAHAQRKRHKPDVEALARLPDGRLLALGSGSTERRRRGVLIDPARGFATTAVDLSRLYDALASNLPELNVEGAAVHDGRLLLAQRGNGKAGVNACIELDLTCMLHLLEATRAITPEALVAIHPVELGSLDGTARTGRTALSFTDLASHERGLLFSAAAEPSGSTYEDAQVVGSVVGILDERFAVRRHAHVDAHKIEGIVADAEGGLWIVADADDRAQPAPLLHAQIAQL